MSGSDFLHAEARPLVSKAIAAVELRTSAEVVVTVRKTSGHYGQADATLGAVMMMVGLLVFLYHPAPFDEDLFPLVEVAFFAVGVVFSRALPPLRRLLTPRQVRLDAVRAAARAAFVDQGITRTRDRTGILLYVSLFEKKLEVVTDLGVPVEPMGEGWRQALVPLHQAAEAVDVASFIKAIEGLAPPLEKALPRSEDDVNELSDEVNG